MHKAIRQITDNKIAHNYAAKDLTHEASLAVTEATDYYEKETTDYEMKGTFKAVMVNQPAFGS